MENAKEIISTYAIRFSRKLMLDHICGESHPITEIEKHLVEVAKASLVKVMISEDLDKKKVIREIRAIASKATIEKMDDATISERICKTIEQMKDKSILDVEIPQSVKPHIHTSVLLH